MQKNIKAQDAFLGDFKIVEIEGSVFLKWEIKAGNTCDGVRVYRSADNIFFEEIGRIEGVCGSPFSSVTYEFTDTTPLLNRNSFYRLELGNLGYSNVLNIVIIDFSKNNFRIFPNPAVEFTKVYFKNPSQQTSLVELFKLNGQKVFEKRTTEYEITIPISAFEAAVYLIRISDSEGKVFVNAKLIKKSR
ncbi:MAG: hypothetical protein FD155_825 [Bacteroidetes bacterium]|nr:MAG: hypothetical protein FD155_825 [Bacteroidota bacterium]